MDTVATTDIPSEKMLAEAMAVPERQEPVFGKRNLIVAAILFVTALLSLMAIETAFHIPIRGVSRAPHYIYQAEVFCMAGGTSISQLRPPM